MHNYKMNNYEHNKIKGLYYIPNYLTEAENKKIMTYLGKTTKWSKVGKSADSRRVIQFGYTYAYNRSGVQETDPLPKYLKELVSIERINKLFSDPVIKEELDQLIINEYKSGQGIHPHIDHVKYFSDVIVCLTLGSGTNIEFSRDGLEETVYVEPRSLYIMSSESRYKWRHGINMVVADGKIKRGTRYSLTYRTVKQDSLDKTVI